MNEMAQLEMSWGRMATAGLAWLGVLANLPFKGTMGTQAQILERRARTP
jgi:hypothetical protein